MKFETEQEARRANAKEWAKSLTDYEIDYLLNDGRGHLLQLGQNCLNAVRREWNHRQYHLENN